MLSALLAAAAAGLDAARRAWRANHASAPEADAQRASDAQAQQDADAAGLHAPILDPATLDALERLGGPRFVTDVADQFAAEASQLMLRIAASVAARDGEEFRAQVHALRSSAGNVGAMRLYRLCLEWRDIDGRALSQGGAARVEALRREFDAARGALAARLGPEAASGLPSGLERRRRGS